MAKGIVVPKGVQVSKKTLELLNSAAYLQRQKEREERVASSQVESGFFPEGDLGFKVVGFDVNPQKSRKTQKLYADDWAVRCVISDPARADDGQKFTKHYRIFVEDAKKVAEAKKEGKQLFSRDAGELKQLLAAPLSEDERTPDAKGKTLVDYEKNWGKILIKLAAEGFVLSGRAYTTERPQTDEKGENTGESYRDTHLLVFGIVEDQEEPGTESAEEAAEGEEATEEAGEAAPEEDAEVTEEETEAEEGEEGEEGEEEEEAVNIEVGSVVTVNHPKRGEITAVVKEIDEDAQTFKGSFSADGKKLNAVFNLADITAVND